MTSTTHDDTRGKYGGGRVYKTAIQNSFMDFCSGLGKGTDRIADVFVDSGGEGGESKGKRIGRESIDMVRNIARDISEDMAEVSFRGIVCDTSYGIGRLSRRTRDLDCRRIFRGMSRGTGRVSGTMARTDFRRVLRGTSHEMGRLVGVTSNVIRARP